MDFTQKYSFWIISVLVICGVIGLLVVSTDSKNATMDNANTTQQSGTNDTTLYLSEAPNEIITLVEYSDFQCPACAGMFELLNQAKEEFSDEVSFEFRHFPLTSIHPNAMTAHRIAQAAENQGQFVFVHDLLFMNTQAWTNASNPTTAIYSLISASTSTIDLEMLKSDVSNSETLSAIDSDISLGKQAGVQGTPSLFINDQQIQISNYASLRATIQSELDKTKEN